jgi:hypothetical protein
MGARKGRRERQLKRLNGKLNKLDKFLETAEPRKGLPGDEVKSNTTDDESGFIKGAKGYIQGYNGVTIADSGSQAIIAAEVTGGVAEGGMFPQMLHNLEGNMKLLTWKEGPFKKAIAVGDTGNFSEDNLQEAAKQGVEVLTPAPQFRKRGPQFDGRKGHEMKEKKDEPMNREIYSRRRQIIEPLFSGITYCKGMKRFTLRAKEK